MKTPLVSVIMPAYNAEKTIAESIQSVIDQTYQNWELIIINDGSKDDTNKAVEPFLVDSRIRLLSQENQGVAAARNSGIKASNGEYIAFLDSDDLWLEDKLEKQTTLFVSLDGSYGLVHSKWWNFTDNPAGCYIKDYAEFVDLKDDFERLLICDYISTLTVMIRKKAIEQVGFFDIDLFGTEDWDLWIRIASAYKIYLIDQRLAYYRVHSNGISGNRKRHLSEEKKVIDKHSRLMSADIYRLAMWVWHKKHFYNCFKNKNLCALKYFFQMLLDVGISYNIYAFRRFWRSGLRVF